MKHSNISVFIPHIGCPMMCSFCNQRTISGTQKAPSGEEVREICREAFTMISDKENCEIAFFGGSFTAIPHDYRIELLESVRDFVGKDKLKGIRISTRPDCIDLNIAKLLAEYKEKYYPYLAFDAAYNYLAEKESKDLTIDKNKIFI